MQTTVNWISSRCGCLLPIHAAASLGFNIEVRPVAEPFIDGKTIVINGRRSAARIRFDIAREIARWALLQRGLPAGTANAAAVARAMLSACAVMATSLKPLTRALSRADRTALFARQRRAHHR